MELLQRRKDYKEAVSLLRKLLGQKVYCVDYRGHWWERLALNYDAHLKNPEKVFPFLVHVSKFATMKNHLPGRFVVNGKFLILKQFKVFLFNLLDCSPLIKN